MRNSFFDWINQTKNDARIFIILGELDCHLGLLKAFYDHGLFTDNSEDEYFVIGVNIDVYDESGIPINANRQCVWIGIYLFASLKGPQKYLKGLLEDDEEEKPEPYILESKINFETNANFT